MQGAREGLPGGRGGAAPRSAEGAGGRKGPAAGPGGGRGGAVPGSAAAPFPALGPTSPRRLLPLPPLPRSPPLPPPPEGLPAGRGPPGAAGFGSTVLPGRRCTWPGRGPPPPRGGCSAAPAPHLAPADRLPQPGLGSK
ncbi:basic proline-rich protein-like [Caloenas nicobarica]|uniref:basic proline-rich protein-like n=1 Tax=Caloenas nicobarica TaxID=187106 RepID=UPI0032B7B710